MPLTSKQRAALEAKAKERGVDPAELIAEAEAMSSGVPAQPGNAGASASTGEKPKLFMYLLPFVTVREVRQVWLELEDSFPGDNAVAAEWAAKFNAGGGDGGEPPPEAA